MSQIQELRQRQQALLTEAETLAGKEADGTITADESARLDALTEKGGELDKMKGAIARAESLADYRRSVPAVATVENPAATTVVAPSGHRSVVPAEPKKEAGKFGSLGELLASVARAAMNPQQHWSEVDNRLRYEAAPLGANEATPSEGGFLVQQDFSMALLQQMHDMGEIISRVRRVPIGAQFNGIKLPALDETSRANGSRFGGVQAYWADEAASVTATKPKFRAIELALKKLFGVGYATDELLQDQAALENVMSQAFTEELTFKTEDGIVNGTGSGQPLGFLNSGALVTVAAESGQAAATIRTENVLKMWARTPIRSRRSLVWMCNQDIEPQLWSLTLGSGTAVTLLYTPPGANGNNSPYGLLLGRPVIPIEYAATLGTVGDLVLWDPMQYVIIDKGGVQTAASIHVAFLTNESCFRWIYRVDGQPIWRSAVTPFKGTNTISPYVALATR